MFTFMAAALAAAALGAASPADDGRPIVIGRGYDLPSAVLHQTRRINVYLPPDFAERKEPLPVEPRILPVCLLDCTLAISFFPL